MNVPKDLLYAKSHEWVKFLDGGNALVGITDYAQHALSDLVFANLCEEGDVLGIDDPLGDVESIKAVSEVFCPIGGKVVRTNQDVLDNPEKLNTDPYGSWMIELTDVIGKEELISPEEYEELIKEED